MAENLREVRIITIDDHLVTAPVMRRIFPGYHHQVELSYDYRPDPDKEEWATRNLFLAQFPHSGISLEQTWRPIEHEGIRELSRGRALMEIGRILEARLIDDFQAVDASDYHYGMLKMQAFLTGFKHWIYGVDIGVNAKWNGRAPRISLYNLLGGENKREHTWPLDLTESQTFEEPPEDTSGVPIIIEHTSEKIRATKKPDISPPRRTYIRHKEKS